MLNSKELLSYTKKLSILFIEDHDDLRTNTTEILKNFFDVVDSSVNGEEALHTYKTFYDNYEKYYDIILSDIQMPRLNGVELTENIYNINPKQIVIILSAHDDTKHLLPLINLGIEQFIKKPIDYQDLLSVLLNASKKIKLTDTLNIDETRSVQVKLNNSFVFDRDNNSLFEDKNLVYLTKYEIIFLRLLSEHIGKIYSNEDITSHYKTLNENLDATNIRKLVSKLRKKLPENSIESIYGIGYRIIPFFEV
ncbi:MAG: transcriptional regulator [Sulfurimonas sp.]|nr:MAG: transcriptional regulator [Sulfurimonas sp.]